MEWQTVQTQIRLLLEEQSDRLPRPICPKTWDRRLVEVYCILLCFQEIVDNPEYVTAGASRFDVQQGELGE